MFSIKHSWQFMLVYTTNVGCVDSFKFQWKKIQLCKYTYLYVFNMHIRKYPTIYFNDKWGYSKCWGLCNIARWKMWSRMENFLYRDIFVPVEILPYFSPWFFKMFMIIIFFVYSYVYLSPLLENFTQTFGNVKNTPNWKMFFKGLKS